MGQEQTCCCKSKEKNDIELDRLDNNINNYENLESFISPTNSIINSNKFSKILLIQKKIFY